MGLFGGVDMHAAVGAVEVQGKAHGTGPEEEWLWQLPPLRGAQALAEFAAQTVAGGHDAGGFLKWCAVGLQCRLYRCG